MVYQCRVPVSAIIVVPIQQHLLVSADITGCLDEIEELKSHSHAIAQCQQYLHQHIPQADIQFTSSTGKAAEVVSSTEKPIAAIGNKLAASEYGLHTYKEDIHDYPNNHTRFLVLSKDKDTV